MDLRVSVDVKRPPSLLSAALPIRTMEVIPTPETHRQYVDEKNGKLQTAATSHDGADAKFRRAVFDLFAGTRALLTRVTVGDLIGQFRKRGKVETLSVDATCGEALDLLANPEPGILSAPVIDQDRLLFLGFMDVADFLAGFMFHLEKVKPPPVAASMGPDTPRGATTTTQGGASPLPRAALQPVVVERILKDEGRRTWIESVTAEDLNAAGKAFFATTVRDARAQLCGNEDGRMVYAGKRDLPLLELIRGGFLRFILTPGSAQPGWDATKASGATVTTVPRRAIACHRVAIYRLDYDPAVRDDTMCIDAVLSQSDVIRLLNKHLDDLGDVTNKSLHDIGLGGDWDDGSDPGAGAGVAPGDEVTCVLPTASALEAFSLMNAWGLSAVGVVSEPRGPLVDCLSVSDLRGVKAGDFTSLNASVSEFTKRGRMAGANPIDPAPVTVRPDADLGEVISKMCDRGVHRVFVTDLEGRPVRMITPTDILRSITMPAMHSNVGWRFQAAEISSKYARSRDGVEREAEPTRVDDGRKFHDEM